MSGALARKSAAAAFEARDAAKSAAGHAYRAADAAEEAAKHAGDSSKAAAESSKHASEAKRAADAADAAVTAAKKVFDVARETESEDLASRTAAAVERARDQKRAAEEFTVQVGSFLRDDRELDKEADRLATEAAKPNVDVPAMAVKGRELALKVLKSKGPWSQEAAARALSGSEQDVLAYVRHGLTKASQDDLRQRVTRLTYDSPFEAVRKAATGVLEDDDAGKFREFLTVGQYQAAVTDYRIQVGQIHSSGDSGVKEAAETALRDGSPKALIAFINNGQYLARNTDERVRAGQLHSAGGPEVKSAAKIALAGPPDLLHYFVQAGQYMADRQDQLAATHIAQMQRLIAGSSQTAAKARQNAWEAARAAAIANKAAAEANEAAGEAKKSSDQAAKFAADAKKSAQAAAISANAAAKSATTARNAAAAANRDASAAEASATRAEFSASYARDSAREANAASNAARASAAAAGKSAEDAEKEASAAWKATYELRRKEEAEAARLAEEARKKKEEAEAAKEKEKGTPCLPPITGKAPPNWVCLLKDDAYVDVEGAEEARKAYTDAMKDFLFSVDELKECIDDPGISKCGQYAASMTPSGKLKKLAKINKKIDEIAESTRLRKLKRSIEKLCKTKKKPEYSSLQQNTQLLPREARSAFYATSSTTLTVARANDAGDLGIKREEYVASLVGGTVPKDSRGQDIKLVMPNVGSTGLDVLGPNGEFIFVGGGAKAKDPAKFGKLLKISKFVADQAGVNAVYYLADNTPDTAIKQAKKAFGEENVHIFTLPEC
ncbi:ALF repeat-containing protein [Streptomyces sp. YPW6]|uniref:ALF repeat-containing protein n=1 Tax=Streptomyces sp. YPW6 TaxID=2840373 RepID=UPI001C0C7537|nr:ALF repeat-containing protein [Streptomyces sp. YPW6]QWQ43770.1 ALF repeat-containing protein [Streptomyces sp. YPW6]